jgi:ribose 5-phosphate isomerase B
MRIAIAGDHAGFALKEWLAGELVNEGFVVENLGARDTTPSDYPDFARAVARAVVSGSADRGIIVCGSGVGASVAANKVRGIRAGVVHDTYSAHQGVEHDDMTVLCMGSRVVGQALALDIVRAFLRARFATDERFRRRLQKVLDIEARGE